MSDHFFDAAFSYIKSNYSDFFTDSPISRKSKPSSFKEFLFDFAFFKEEDSEIISYIDESNNKKFKTSVFYEFENFYSKSMIQYNDFSLMISTSNTSNTWNIVTFYYMLFFLITSLLKITKKGYVYFSTPEAKDLNARILNPSITNIFKRGTYFYEILEEEKLFKIKFIHQDSSSIHEKNWKLFSDLIVELKNNSISGTQEALFLNSIKNHFDKYTYNFPCELRNRLNYQGIYAAEELVGRVPNIYYGELKNILSLNPRNQDSDAIKLEVMGYLSQYLCLLIQKIHKDIIERQGKKNCEFDQLRKEKLQRISFI